MLEKVVFVPLRQDKLQLMDTFAVAGVELVTFRLRDFSHPAHHNTAAVLWGFKLNCKQAAFFHMSSRCKVIFMTP